MVGLKEQLESRDKKESYISMEVRAITKNYGQSSKKVRRLLGLIRGKSIDGALAALQFHPSPAAEAVSKTIRSAAANAENNYMLIGENLKVVAAFADDGPFLKRFRPQSRGRVSPIKKRTSHITVVLDGEES